MCEGDAMPTVLREEVSQAQWDTYKSSPMRCIAARARENRRLDRCGWVDRSAGRARNVHHHHGHHLHDYTSQVLPVCQ